MHRALTIAVAPERTDELLEELQRFEKHVVTISVQRGASIKPPRDIVDIQVLNRATSAVLEVIERHRCDGTRTAERAPRQSRSDMTERFVTNHHVGELANPSTTNLLISAAGAVAGGLVITAYRMALLAGPIVALQIVSSAAMVGVAAAAGKWDLSAQALWRFAIDAGFILLGGLLVFWIKERFAHRRVVE